MSPPAQIHADRLYRPACPNTGGLARSMRLFRLFLTEQADPERYYASLAEDAIAQITEYCELPGRVVLDVGGGGGWFTAAFRARGASCFLFEPDPSELHSRQIPPPGAVLADGLSLPVRDGAADVVFSSNVLEHVPVPMTLIEEMLRVTRPGGLVYIAYTNWFSPWGGHEMAPWHYLGQEYAERHYLRRHGRKPKHHVGATLFPLHIGPLLRALRSRADIEIMDARPRYYPGWCRPLVRVPGLREVATWNLLLIIRRIR
jgi:SAM-dependent methyltransferase